MPVIVVANPKGGVGKSTVATNLAGWLARQGHVVMLGDLDTQQSSRQWLAARPAQLPHIHGWDVTTDRILRPPKGTTHVVLDTPAGLSGARLDAALNIADKLLIPLQASLFDMQATHAFVQALRAHRRFGHWKIALVGMRVKEHALSRERLDEFVAALGLPLVARLRDTQNYVHLAAHGLTLFDIAPGRVERDLEQFAPLAAWLADE